MGHMARDLILASWRSTTKRQYSRPIKLWVEFCVKRKDNCLSPHLENILDFLAYLFDKGLGYSAINTARSALSTLIFFDKKPVGQHPLVIRLLKGVFNKRPSLPRTNVTWNP